MTNKLRETKPNVLTFVGRYVFPGGYLPTIHMLLDSSTGAQTETWRSPPP
ncbi:uncharacterized protein EURHEDRAFT_381312 [Aspergillus ruber CBS 135680]|uniref:Uncharacterized protein n=1 Tax=Aspergillus ruber (strain CBS 135680) TaxID=1388766 RepID=A0A017S4L0_ASPRC|nr:uncharacterized protein EURHEDRAFT_381312 [Aspergillus ruber CBS 135680]EYE91100.1 hypothetical protein EURHEDRAFT_381312 [Aspergillus ruber CBS 135680]